MDHAWAIIMAGGSGTRFWPLSRRLKPKQLLALAGGERSLLAETVARIAPLVPPERVIVVTARHLADATRADLPAVPSRNVLAEPVGRNTAPCVGWAAAHIQRRDPDALVAVLAADHHITDEAAFLEVLGRALGAAREGHLVTVGVTPTRPETGYGYLEVGAPLDEGVHQALRFVEKPTRERAEEFLARGTFLWNSGMFFFRAAAARAAVQAHLPDLGLALDALDQAAAEGHEDEALERLYPTLPSVSFDHGVLERAARVAVVPGAFGWSDVGSWVTAWELAPKDARGNASTAPADVVFEDAAGCYVHAPPGKVVALVGVEDLVVVDTEDALLVMPRHRAQDVRAVVEALRARGRDERL